MIKRRRAIWRRWLAPCIAAFALQAAAPALAWCLHHGDAPHVEAALAHCDHEDSQPQRVDAQQPASAVGQGGGAPLAPCLVSTERRLLVDWLDDDSPCAAALTRRTAEPDPPPRIEHLSGHTTRLRI